VFLAPVVWPVNFDDQSVSQSDHALYSIWIGPKVLWTKCRLDEMSCGTKYFGPNVDWTKCLWTKNLLDQKSIGRNVTRPRKLYMPLRNVYQNSTQWLVYTQFQNLGITHFS